MPGDLNRVMLIGEVLVAPEAVGRGVRFRLRTGETWTDRATGEARLKVMEHAVLVLNPALAAFVGRMRVGDQIFVEGQLEGSTVVLGALHSSVQLLKRASQPGGPD